MRRKHISTAYHGGIASYDVARGGFTLDESTYAPGLRMPMHAHERAPFGIVLEGSFTERIGRGKLRARRSPSCCVRPANRTPSVFTSERGRASSA